MASGAQTMITLPRSITDDDDLTGGADTYVDSWHDEPVSPVTTPNTGPPAHFWKGELPFHACSAFNSQPTVLPAGITGDVVVTIVYGEPPAQPKAWWLGFEQMIAIAMDGTCQSDANLVVTVTCHNAQLQTMCTDPNIVEWSVQTLAQSAEATTHGGTLYSTRHTHNCSVDLYPACLSPTRLCGIQAKRCSAGVRDHDEAF